MGVCTAFLYRFQEDQIVDLGPLIEQQTQQALAQLGVQYNSSSAFAVNDARQVVGAINYQPQYSGIGFLYDDSTGKVSLVGFLAGGKNSVPVAINNNGTIVGNADIPNPAGGSFTVPFVFKNNVMRQIGPPVAGAAILGTALDVSQLTSTGAEFIVGRMKGLSPQGNGGFFVSLAAANLGGVSITA